MTLISNKRQFFVKQYGNGTGNYYRYIRGKGVFFNSIKTLGRLLSEGVKTMYTRAKPKALQFLKETALHLKPKVTETLKRVADSTIDAILNDDVSGIPKRLRRTFTDGKENLIQNLKDATPDIKRKAVKTIFDIVNGSGLRLSSNSRQQIKQLLQ